MIPSPLKGATLGARSDLGVLKEGGVFGGTLFESVREDGDLVFELGGVGRGENVKSEG